MTKGVHDNVDQILEHLRHLYNDSLQERIDCYQKTGKGITYFDQAKSLTQKRQDIRHSWIPLVCQRSILSRLDEAFKGFFRRHKKGQAPGFPRFKGYGRIRSFDLPISEIRKHNKDFSCIKIKGIGKIKFRHLNDVISIKQIRLVKKALRTEIQFVVEMRKKIESAGGKIGLDLGVSNRIMTSDGEFFKGVKIDRAELKRKQQILSNAKHGSKSRRKKRLAFAKEWERTVARERNALHRITTEIIKKYKTIMVEKLDIQKMSRNRYLAKGIHEQQWGELIRQLTYKAENAGGEVIQVDPRYTSQICSSCGNRQKMPLHVRTYDCPSCGFLLDRDHNAAINILNGGVVLAPMTANA